MSPPIRNRKPEDSPTTARALLQYHPHDPELETNENRICRSMARLEPPLRPPADCLIRPSTADDREKNDCAKIRQQSPSMSHSDLPSCCPKMLRCQSPQQNGPPYLHTARLGSSGLVLTLFSLLALSYTCNSYTKHVCHSQAQGRLSPAFIQCIRTATVARVTVIETLLYHTAFFVRTLKIFLAGRIWLFHRLTAHSFRLLGIFLLLCYSTAPSIP